MNRLGCSPPFILRSFIRFSQKSPLPFQQRHYELRWYIHLWERNFEENILVEAWLHGEVNPHFWKNEGLRRYDLRIWARANRIAAEYYARQGKKVIGSF